jgi:hypothetical protein
MRTSRSYIDLFRGGEVKPAACCLILKREKICSVSKAGELNDLRVSAGLREPSTYKLKVAVRQSQRSESEVRDQRAETETESETETETETESVTET